MTDTIATSSHATGMTQALAEIAGTYTIDPTHSAAEFVARHMMLTKVRGRFGQLEGEIRIAPEPERSRVDVVIQAASLDTGDDTRDEHLRGADFLDVATFPTIEFHSTKVEPGDSGARVTGDLTIKGTAHPVVLDVEFAGVSPDPWGNSRAGFDAETEIDREDWGLTWNVALESGGVLVGKKVKLELSVEAIKQ